MSRIASLLVVAVLAASAQCVADCGILPCNKQASQPAPVAPCHHPSAPDKTAPASPTNHDHSAACGHQKFVSEAGLQASAVHADLDMAALLPVDLDETLPESQILIDPASDRSPPLHLSPARRTVLRV